MSDSTIIADFFLRGWFTESEREMVSDALGEIVSASRSVLMEALKPYKQHDKKIMMAADERLAKAVRRFDKLVGKIN